MTRTIATRLALVACVEIGVGLGMLRSHGLPPLEMGTESLSDAATGQSLISLAGVLAVAGLLAVAAFFVVTGCVYAVAVCAGWTGAARAVGVLTVPIVRRAADRLAAVSLSTALLATGIQAAGPPDQHPDAQQDDHVARIDAIPHPALRRLLSPTSAPDPAPGSTVPSATLQPITPPPASRPDRGPDVIGRARDASQPEESSDATEYTVERGDNFWTISAHHLADMSEHPVSVGVYWRRVIAENIDRIRSGDPDLIFPGEIIVLPPVTDL